MILEKESNSTKTLKYIFENGRDYDYSDYIELFNNIWYDLQSDGVFDIKYYKSDKKEFYYRADWDDNIYGSKKQDNRKYIMKCLKTLTDSHIKRYLQGYYKTNTRKVLLRPNNEVEGEYIVIGK